MKSITETIVAAGALASLFAGASVLATDYSSTNFVVKDPVIAPGSGFATSSAFQLWSVIGEPAIGISAGGTFTLKGGFLYFPAPASATSTPPESAAAPHPVDYGPFVFIPSRVVPLSAACDFNEDGVCGIADFSILLYYYERSGPSVAKYDLNKNETVDFPDISILFYYWESFV
ncbi:MAG: hypothetical protein V1885_00405 [Candidatus Brennerbacteria bacterium]